MNRETAVGRLHTEVETLIRLHQHGLYDSHGYRTRKRKIEEFIREHGIDVKKELDPVTLVLYRRYLE